MSVSRRNFLKGAAAGTAGAALTGATLIGGARADADAGRAVPLPSSYPFHGTHQAGILTPGPAAKQSAACVAAFDVTARGRAGLAGLMRTLTSRARFLTSGGNPPTSGSASPRRTAPCSARPSRPTG